MTNLKKKPIDWRSMFRLRAIARMISGEIFLRGHIRVRYGVSRYNLSAFGLSSTKLWLISDPQKTALSQKVFRRDSVSTKCTQLFLKYSNS